MDGGIDRKRAIDRSAQLYLGLISSKIFSVKNSFKFIFFVKKITFGIP